MSMRNFISRWLFDLTFFASPRGVTGRLKNVLAFEIGVIRKNVLDRLPGGAPPWPTITPTVTPCPADARLAAHDLRVLRDALEVVYRMPLREKL